MKILKEFEVSCRACDYEHDGKEECTHGTPETDKYVLILPGCCEGSRSACTPHVRVFLDGPEEDDVWKPLWYMPMSGTYEHRKLWCREEDMQEVSFMEGGTKWKEPKANPPVSHCPYCGTKLPELEADPNPPSPITNMDSDGHCTCEANKYGRDCSCWPREVLYRVKGAPNAQAE